MQLQPGALEVDQVLEVEIAVGPIPELFLQARNAFVQVVDLTLLSVSGGIDQRKSQLHHFTIGFQKPGICADSWFLESNGKMVQLGFSLIKNRAPHGAGLLCPPGYTFYSRSCASTYKFWLAQVG